MVEISRVLAERISDAARLLEEDSDDDAVLERLTRLAVELVPGATAAALTVEGQQQRQPMTFAASDPRIDELHELQFQLAEGPAVEALRYNEPRRIDDIDTDHRWPAFRRAAARARFGSCLMLPLRTDRQPSGAMSLYSEAKAAFRGSSHDVAMLFAAQGGAAVDNAAVYQTSQRMIDNLHTALRSRAGIEQAKGILHAKLGVSPDEAFTLLSRRSHHTNRKLRAIAWDLVHGDIDSSEFR
jgi:GAF domain-containing protein